MNQDDRQLLDRALARLALGDRTAFDQVYVLLAPALTGFVRKAMVDDAEGEDAAQNTLMKVFGRVSDYRPGTDALAWVLTLAAFEVATLRKRRRRGEVRQASAEALSSLEAEDDVERVALEHEARAQLQAAVGQLAVGDQNVLLSSEMTSKTPRARKQKQRALQRLRDLWRRINGDE